MLPRIPMPKICPACRKENRDEANYCMSCGVALTGQAVPKAMAPPQIPLLAQPSAMQSMARGCLFHTYLPSLYNCSDCASPICVNCARLYMQAVYCPICFAKRNFSWRFPQQMIYWPGVPRIISGRSWIR